MKTLAEIEKAHYELWRERMKSPMYDTSVHPMQVAGSALVFCCSLRDIHMAMSHGLMSTMMESTAFHTAADGSGEEPAIFLSMRTIVHIEITDIAKTLLSKHTRWNSELRLPIVSLLIGRDWHDFDKQAELKIKYWLRATESQLTAHIQKALEQ